MTAPGNTPTDYPHADSRDERIVRRARTLYRDAAQRIDPATAGQLRAARRKALETTRRATHQHTRWMMPTGALAAIAFALLIAWQPLSHGPSVPAQQSIGEQTTDADIELLPPDAEKTDPKLYQNLDFYGWLAANNASNDQPVNR